MPFLKHFKKKLFKKFVTDLLASSFDILDYRFNKSLFDF